MGHRYFLAGLIVLFASGAGAAEAEERSFLDGTCPAIPLKGQSVPLSVLCQIEDGVNPYSEVDSPSVVPLRPPQEGYLARKILFDTLKALLGAAGSPQQIDLSPINAPTD